MDAREIELPVVDLGRRPPIRLEMTVRQVVADDPGCREVFRRHGESEGCPTRFGHLEPLDRFARRHGVPLDALLAELSSAGRDVLIGVLGGFAWSLAPEHWGLAGPARAGGPRRLASQERPHAPQDQRWDQMDDLTGRSFIGAASNSTLADPLGC